jgi:hypothetical protein
LSLGVHVVCASQSYSTDPVVLTRPRVVVDMARDVGLTDVKPVSGKPWILETESDLEDLRSFLNDGRRGLPVYLLTQPDDQDSSENGGGYLCDAEELARRTLGLAHVVLLPFSLGVPWIETVGLTWSAYLGGVRRYRPGLDFENDLPDEHPVVLPAQILRWRHAEKEQRARMRLRFPIPMRG